MNLGEFCNRPEELKGVNGRMTIINIYCKSQRVGNSHKIVFPKNDTETLSMIPQ